jgi:hypothetical protein
VPKRQSGARARLAGAALALLCAGTLGAQRGALVAPRNLTQMVDAAGVIVRGRIVSARVERDPEYRALETVVVTLQVDETLKGKTKTGDTYTFRQFLWDARGGAAGAGYSKGSEVLLLLLTPNQHGLSSPVGMDQGRFRIVTGAKGVRYAVNGRNNAGLLSGVAARARAKGLRLTPRAASLLAARPHGPVALDDLSELIRQLAGTN